MRPLTFDERNSVSGGLPLGAATGKVMKPDLLMPVHGTGGGGGFDYDPDFWNSVYNPGSYDIFGLNNLNLSLPDDVITVATNPDPMNESYIATLVPGSTISHPIINWTGSGGSAGTIDTDAQVSVTVNASGTQATFTDTESAPIHAANGLTVTPYVTGKLNLVDGKPAFSEFGVKMKYEIP